MSESGFSRKGGQDLYVGTPGSFGTPFRGPYYLLLDPDGEAPDDLSFDQTWRDPAVAGVYVFTPLIAVSDPASVAAAIRTVLIGRTGARLAWFVDPNAPRAADPVIGVQNGSTTQDFAPTWRNLILTIDGGAAVIKVSVGDVPAVAIGGPGSVFLQSSDSSPLLPSIRPVTISLFGSDAGVLGFAANFSSDLLSAYGGDVRYFTAGTPGSWPVVQIRYPLLAFDGRMPLNLFIDPVAISEPERSRAELAGTGELNSFLRTTSGRPIGLTATAGAGFSFEAAPPASGDDAAFYLAPRGVFLLGCGDEITEPRLMCGTSGTEYVYAEPGSAIEFIPGQAAYAPKGEGGLRPEVPPGAAASLSAATTSWTRCRPATATVRADSRFGYYAQPDGAVFYGRALEGEGAFSAARTVLVSQLQQNGGQPESVGYPLAPYAGIGQTASGRPVNPDLDAAVVEQLETLVLAPERRRRVPPLAAGPVFDPGSAQPKLADSTDVYGLTPQGLLAVLGSSGRWRELVIARDPGVPPSEAPRFLSLAPADPSQPDSSLPPELADAFMHPSLFLLISENRSSSSGSPALGTFNSRLTIEGFTLDLAPATSWQPGAGAILIFKFHDGALVDLVNDVTTWSAADAFNRRAADGSYPVQAYVAAVIAEALAHKDDPYLDTFRTVVTEASWQGVLAIDCALASNGLPQELEGLLGGMSAPLRGHHLGIEIGHLTLEEPLANLRSSAFGLIRYPPIGQAREHTFPVRATPDTGVDYSVDELNVLFLSSAVHGFSARVWLTLRELFGRPFNLTPEDPRLPADTVELLGAMQRHGGEPVFSFEMDAARVFEAGDADSHVRALTKVGVSRAVFSTRSSVVNSETGATDVKARFALDGALSFAAAAFAGSGGQTLDPFGYGDPDAGSGTPLPASGLNVDVQFSLPGGRRPAVDRNVVFAPALTFSAAATAAPRPGSLPHELPLTLSSFLYDAEGLSATALGGQSCFAPQFGDGRTATPHYGLSFTLPLGSLGWLSAVHISLVAKLVVAWGPQTTKPEEDGFAVAVQLPQVIPGFRGMNLQGVLKTSVGSANLLRFSQPDVLVLLFNDVKLSLLGFGLPPGYVVDFLIFADPKATQPSMTNLAWLLSARKAPDAFQLEAAS